MTRQGPVGDRFRHYVRSERERRGWSQATLAELLRNGGLEYMGSTTIAKIETGDRGVRVEEASAFADLFDMSMDVMLARGARGADSAWAAAKLSTNAQKTALELSELSARLAEDSRDLVIHSVREGKFEALREFAESAATAAGEIESARITVAALGTQWPLPGVGFDR